MFDVDVDVDVHIDTADLAYATREAAYIKAAATDRQTTVLKEQVGATKAVAQSVSKVGDEIGDLSGEQIVDWVGSIVKDSPKEDRASAIQEALALREEIQYQIWLRDWTKRWNETYGKHKDSLSSHVISSYVRSYIEAELKTESRDIAHNFWWKKLGNWRSPDPRYYNCHSLASFEWQSDKEKENKILRDYRDSIIKHFIELEKEAYSRGHKIETSGEIFDKLVSKALIDQNLQLQKEKLPLEVLPALETEYERRLICWNREIEEEEKKKEEEALERQKRKEEKERIDEAHRQAVELKALEDEQIRIGRELAREAKEASERSNFRLFLQILFGVFLGCVLGWICFIP